ncbi:MAG: PRC-barrel domain-containing protein [Thermosynechococcaceae cyanobacterium]
MSTLNLIRHRDLLNLLVIDRATTDELGRVEVVWMHPPAHRVLGFICKTGPLGGPKLAFNLNQIEQLGPESVVVKGESVVTNTSEVKLLESLIGLEVWNESGAKMGKVTDCLFNLKSGVITQYLFRSDGWRGFTGGVYQLPTGSIQRFGKKRVFVSGTVTKRPQIYQPGLEEKLFKAGDRIQSRFTDLTQQATQQLHQVTGDATSQVQSLTEQATQRVQSLGQQLTEETQSFAQLAKERGQSLLSQVQEQSRNSDDAFEEDDFSWVDDPSTDPDESDSATPVPETSLPQAQDTVEDGDLVWSRGLEDIPPEDLEDDEPWI